MRENARGAKLRNYLFDVRSPMKHKRHIVFALGSVAAITITGLAAVFIPRIRYQLQESELIEIIQAEAPPGKPGAREAAARDLGEMRSVRAIPYIIQLWDTPSRKVEIRGTGRSSRLDRQVRQEHIAGCEALALIGEPAIPFLEEVIRGMEARVTAAARPGRPPPRATDERGFLAVTTCKKLGPAALPLLPVLLECYRERNREQMVTMVVDAILAIGEPESAKEVEPWVSKMRKRAEREAARDAARNAELLQIQARAARLMREAQERGEAIPREEDGSINVKRIPGWYEEEKEMPPEETPSKVKT